MPRAYHALLLVCSALSLLACSNRPPLTSGASTDPPPMAETSSKRRPRMVAAEEPPTSTCVNCPTPEPDYAPAAEEIPAEIERIPDAVPVEEPRSRGGNPDSYEVLGKRYQVIKKVPPGYREKGRASWYGKKFHGRRTANGEIYDMFKMTAAHKTLPLPSYVRATNKSNGRSVVVRINDRGPFHPGRIIDLSYAAAVKIDLLHSGSAEVELEVLSSREGKTALDAGSGKPRYLEVGRFIDPIDAAARRDRLRQLGFADTEFLQVPSPAGDGVENILRLGPFQSFSALESARVKLGLQEITAIPVAD